MVEASRCLIGHHDSHQCSVGWNLLWVKQLGVGPTITAALSAATDGAGNVLLTGSTRAGLAGNALTGAQDAFVSKYDTDGNLIWLKQIGAADVLTGGWAVSADYADSVLVSGFTAGGLDGNTLAGLRDYWIGKYSSVGTLE